MKTWSFKLPKRNPFFWGELAMAGFFGAYAYWFQHPIAWLGVPVATCWAIFMGTTINRRKPE